MKINIKALDFVVKLKLKSRLTNISIKKIDNLSLKIHSMALTSFLLQDSLKKI